ncbi:hypothetical protein P9222_00395 [Paenibacillus amylolyticus]|nr:hypothetical protein [Paenibacillus amylolyticus]WFR62950.1 hypothetical protein P9222_00395 [Paenibacillus amylolyticus]
MMKKVVRKRIRYSTLLALILVIALAGCTPGSSSTGEKTADGRELKQFSAFFAVPGKIAPDDNRVLKAIEEKQASELRWTGLRAKQPKSELVYSLQAANIQILLMEVMVLSNW